MKTHYLLDRFFPMIQPHDWPGKSATLHRSLCFMPRLVGTPWLSFYFELDGKRNYVDSGVLARLGLGAEQLEAVAIRNVVRTSAVWEPLRLGAAVVDQRVVLRCIDQPHACERILEPEFLEQGRGMLSAKALCATLPQRGMLLVAPFDDFEILMRLGKHFHDNAENPRISPWVFAIKDGAICGRFFEENGEVGLDAVVPPKR